MQLDLTRGSVTKGILLFAFPMICGNMLQQLYNVVDTLIVGRFLGADALAAVGSSYTLMTFLTSILLGMSMGSGAIFSIRYGEKRWDRLKAVSYTHLYDSAYRHLFHKIRDYKRHPDDVQYTWHSDRLHASVAP